MTGDDRLRFENFAWVEYQERTAYREATEYFMSAMAYVDGDNGEGRLAIDLGCGGGAETRALLARGWRVFATDAGPESERLVVLATPLDHRHRLEHVHGKFHEVDLPQADLVYAQYSLPFADDDLEAAVDAAIAAVKPGGAFVGQLFGHNDTWAGDGAASVDREWIEAKFNDFSELNIDEQDFDGSYGGSEENRKRWHVFHIHARR
jgi:SAM-dependent methyltransferase